MSRELSDQVALARDGVDEAERDALAGQDRPNGGSSRATPPWPAMFLQMCARRDAGSGRRGSLAMPVPRGSSVVAPTTTIAMRMDAHDGPADSGALAL